MYQILKKVCFYGENLYYPNIICSSMGKIYYPIKEKIMSLSRLGIKKEIPYNEFENIEKKELKGDFFFFVFNTDNYFHFVYDTLPYLITFFELKKKYPYLVLLTNYPNSEKRENYQFVDEFLDILGIKKSEISIVDSKYEYERVFIPESFTHLQDSDFPNPNYTKIYDLITDNIGLISKKEYPKKIYISRRTWLNESRDNIGTDYTSRRKMINEDDLVELLSKHGYTEVFTENMTTLEKIIMFQNVESVVGSIGGGLCNVVFSKKQTKLLVLVSPTFLSVNARFRHCLSNVNTTYYEKSSHVDEGKWKRYMRVKFGNLVGEIEEVSGNKLTISYVEEMVAGWTKNREYKKITVDENLCDPLDGGLNSPWYLHLDSLEKYL